jgi:hypothetical protein
MARIAVVRERFDTAAELAAVVGERAPGDRRQRCPAGLNKSEQRHALAQVICTFKQGRIADRGREAQLFRARGLEPGDRRNRV